MVGNVKIAQIDVELHSSVLVAVLGSGLLLGFSDLTPLLAWSVVSCGALLAYGMGRSFVHFTYGTWPHMVLWGFGVTTHGPALRRHQALAVSFAGPAACTLLGLPLLALSLRSAAAGGAGVLVEMGATATLGLGLVALVPVLPLAGGEIVACALGGAGRALGVRRAQRVSLVIALAVSGGAAARGVVPVALLGGILAAYNVAGLRSVALVPRCTTRHDPLPDVVAHESSGDLNMILTEVAWELQLGDGAAAMQRLSAVVPAAHASSTQRLLLELRGWAALLSNEPAQLGYVLRALPARSPASRLLASAAGVHRGDRSAAGALAEALASAPLRNGGTRLAMQVAARAGMSGEVAKALLVHGDLATVLEFQRALRSSGLNESSAEVEEVILGSNWAG